jgi:hypothetical protein
MSPFVSLPDGWLAQQNHGITAPTLAGSQRDSKADTTRRASVRNLRSFRGLKGQLKGLKGIAPSTLPSIT